MKLVQNNMCVKNITEIIVRYTHQCFCINRAHIKMAANTTTKVMMAQPGGIGNVCCHVTVM